MYRFSLKTANGPPESPLQVPLPFFPLVQILDLVINDPYEAEQSSFEMICTSTE